MSYYVLYRYVADHTNDIVSFSVCSLICLIDRSAVCGGRVAVCDVVSG